MRIVLAEKTRQEQGELISSVVLSDVKADIISPGGIVMLAITIVITLVLVFSVIVPSIAGMQFVIVFLLTLACWMYLLNVATEKLKINRRNLEYKSLLSRSYRFDIASIQAYKLTDLGVRLNGDFYLLEISVADRDRPVEIGLGPCWHKHQLLGFCNMIEQELNYLENDQ